MTCLVTVPVFFSFRLVDLNALSLLTMIDNRFYFWLLKSISMIRQLEGTKASDISGRDKQKVQINRINRVVQT